MVASSKIPQIVTFQMDSSAIGKARSNVNLFRGDVNLSQPLFKMPGRASDPGLSVTVSLLYQSNVWRAATTWNRDAPTGSTGLGWLVPRTCITLDDGGSPTAGSWLYSYSSNGIETPLIREPATPFLFDMSDSLAAGLEDGEPVPDAIAAAFAAHGIGLGASATVTRAAPGSSAWTLTDTDAQRLFTLATETGALKASDGGQSFQLSNYAFWKILYYPVFERWVIVNESGHVFSFGGTAPTISGNCSSIGNSIEWAVRWTSAGGAALWVGPSNETAGQQQYARCWNVASVANIWGDSYRYGYNEWPRDPNTGLIPDVEQQVGKGGKPYTKACYLTSITDVFGRKAIFAYGDKEWSDSSADRPREYADPHKSAPDNTPNAYQDRYETKYLSGITVRATDESKLYGIDFTYTIANVNQYTGALQGDTFKRFLTDITSYNADGASLPGLAFEYCLDPSAPGASPGALAAITYPEGAVVRYTYTQQSLPVCDRTQRVDQPAEITVSATPGVWFGPDYAVTTWLGIGGGPLSLVVYTWLGRWVSWQISPSSPILDNGDDVQSGTLDVIARDDYFAVTFQQGAETAVAYVFRKSVGRPGQWVAAQIAGQPPPSPGQPTLSYSTPGGGAFFCGGTDFLIGGVMSQALGRYQYDRLTWRWTTRVWSKESFSPGAYLQIAAANEYYVALNAASGNLALFYLDPTLLWQAAGGYKLPNYSEPPLENLAINTGQSMVVVSVVGNPRADPLDYTLFVVQWDQSYTFQTPQAFVYSDYQTRFSTGWTGTVVSPGMIACSARLLRFNGVCWLRNDALYDANTNRNFEQRFAYGPDYAVRILAADIGQPTAAVLVFDPDADCSGWTRTATTPKQQLPDDAPIAAGANWPSSGQSDYMAIGQYLYFRGSSTDWSAALKCAPLDLQALVGPGYFLNTQSLINEAPEFLTAYVYPASEQSPQTAVFMLKNGQLAGTGGGVLFTDQLIWVAPASGQAVPGVYPGGPGAFVAYPSSAPSFSQAPYFFLHRYAGDAIDGALIHYAVTGLATDDGLGNVSAIAYAPDPAQAACDPTGLVIKYYQNTSYPGTADPTKPVLGSAVSTYINGLAIKDGLDYHDMLDGLPYGVEICDSGGATLSQTTQKWQVFTTRAADPADPCLPPLNLYGGFVSRTSRTSTVDGVSSTRTTNYCPPGLSAPYSGLPVNSVLTTTGGTGETEAFTTTTLYGYDVDSAFAPLHVLNARAQVNTVWRRGSELPVTVKATASTFVRWPSAVSGSVIVPGPEGDFSWAGEGEAAFPFASYQRGETPKGWLCTHRIVARAPLGVILETQDACGVPHSTLYGGQEFAVADFANASLSAGACAYAGFEAYEDQGGFVATGASIRAGDAHAGSCSLALSPGASLAATITPPNTTQTYLLGYWLKTPPGFRSSDGTGWSIAVSIDGEPPTRRSVPFPGSDGNWLYATISIPLTAGNRSIALTVTARNTSDATILIDDVFVAPLVGTTVMRAFDPGYGLLTCAMTAGGRTTRRLYDRFQRLAATVGPDEQPKEIVQDFLSRSGRTSGAFDAASPNAAVTLHPAAGGSVETFLDGDQWTHRWQASNAANWTVSGGALQHHGATLDTLTWFGWPGQVPATAALSFEVVPQSALAGSIAVTFGSGYRISYTLGTGYAFTAPGGNAVQAPLGSPPAAGSQWLLVLGCGVVLFFADGYLVFSAEAPYGGTGTVSISTGPNALAFRNLAMLAEPRLSVAYSDAIGRQVQIQQLAGDPASASSDSLVLAHIYDPLNRRVATTRTAPGSFGSGASLPVMAYRPGFADVPAFLATLSGSWQLSGDVADYYRGQSDGPVPRSDDQGYPYHGIRYAEAALNRPIEQGVPGLGYDIHDVGTTTPAERNTVQITYGANSGDILDLPAGAFFQRTVTGAAKTQSISLQDSTRRPVAVELLDAAATVQAQTASENTFGSSGGTATMRLPNAFTAGPQSGQAGFVTATLQDFQNRVASRTDPDTGATLCLYDGMGRLRFMQPAPDPGEIGFVYYRFDPIGRIVEEGIVQQPWDPTSLASAAADPAWPSAGVPHSVTRTYAYDGDGSDPSSIGQPVQAVTVNPPPDQSSEPGVVTENYFYDSEGRVVLTTLAVSGLTNISMTVGYAYNNLGEVVTLNYPQGAPLAQVFYARDDQGHISGIGSSADHPADIAAYSYTPDGDVETESRNGGKLVTAYQYNSPGWLVRQQVTAGDGGSPCFSIGMQYNPDGAPKQREISWAFDAPAQTVSAAYAYDGQRRLVSATVTGDTAGNEAITSYDASGNIWGVSLDGETWRFTCAPSSDRLQSAVLPDGTGTSFAYNADGWLQTDRNLAITHDQSLGLATSVTVSGANPCRLRFAYGGSGARVVKEVTGGASPYTRVYVHSIGAEPIAWLQDGAWTAAVPGPIGCAAVKADQLYFPIEDRHRTLWALLDSANALAAGYDYAPFGTPLPASGPATRLLDYQFLGKALDPETGLYDFGARLYDPMLRRFCSPDPAWQFPSPYAFAGNNPLVFLDPSGNLALWEIVGIAVGMAAIAAVGVGLTIFTGGISDALAASAETALAGAAGGTEAGIDAAAATTGAAVTTEAVTTGATGELASATVEAGAGAGAEGGGEASGEVASAAAQARAALLTNLSRVMNVAGSTEGNALISGGQAGMNYDIQNGRHFSGMGLLEAFGSAAVAGAATGFMSSVITIGMASQVVQNAVGRLSDLAGTEIAGTVRYTAALGLQAAAGTTGGVTGQFLHNAFAGAPLGQGLVAAAAGGALRMMAANVLPVSTAGPSQSLARAGLRAFSGGIKIGMSFVQQNVPNANQTAQHRARAAAARATLLTATPALMMRDVGNGRPNE